MFMMISRRHKVRVIIANIAMMVTTLLLAAVLVLVAMGYTLNSRLDIRQTGLVQFASRPSGATVTVNGQTIFGRTSTRSNIAPGENEFQITRDGYDTWTKTTNVNAGHVLWLNYALLLPLDRQARSLTRFDKLDAISASPRGNLIVALPDAQLAGMRLLDIRSSQVRTTNLDFSSVLPEIGSSSNLRRSVSFADWNVDSNRLLAVKEYGDQTDWILLDIRNPENSINLTTEFRLNFDTVKFASNSGRSLWALEDGNLRRINIRNNSISSVLVSNVAQFNIPKRDVVLFTERPDGSGLVSIGVYQDGDRHPSILYSSVLPDEGVIQVVGSRYFGKDYAIILEGNKLTVLKGDFPPFGRPVSSLVQIRELEIDFIPETVSMSPSGRFVMAVSGNRVFSYDLETRRQNTFTLNGNFSDTEQLRWLDDFIIWTDKNDQLTIYDFDGNNKRDVKSVATGFDVLLTSNNRFIYSITRDGDSYRLQQLNLIAR